MKKRNQKVLTILKGLLDIGWYLNFAIIAVGFVLLLKELIFKEYAGFDAPVKMLKPILGSDLSGLTHRVQGASLQAREGMLHMQYKNSPGNTITAYLLFTSIEILTCGILYNLRGIFRSLKQKTPFQYENIKRLRRTALYVALFSPLCFLISFIQSVIVANNVQGYHTLFELRWSFGLDAILIAMVIYSLTEVFQYGFTLFKENEEFV